MRLFYAVNFNDNVKKALCDNLNEIQKYTVRGGFTEKNNFHITLVFVGECDPNKLDSLKKVIDNTIKRINPEPIKAVIDGLGTFSRPGDELLWAGVKIGPENIAMLNKINKTITEELAYMGIYINDGNKKFTPHVTIARKVEFRQITSKEINRIKFNPIDFTIDSLTLMESVQEIKSFGDRRYTKIVYKPIYEVKF